MLDQNVVNLAKAIRQNETGNRAVPGASGELPSRYQYMPATWKTTAKKYLGDENAPITLENENKATYLKIKDWKDAGYNPAQIASMWNSGKPDWQGRVGVNKAGVKYNVPRYVSNVYKNYLKFKSENPPVDQKNPALLQNGDGQSLENQRQPTVKPATVDEKGNISGSGAPLLDKIGNFANSIFAAPAKGVGHLVQALGATEGAIIGGALESRQQISNALLGKDYDFSKVKKSTLQTAKETADFGYDIGKTGAEQAPLGALGRIPNAVMGAVGTYQAGKQLYDSLKNPNAEIDPYSASANLALSLYGFHGAVKSKGLLVNREITNPEKLAKSKMDQATNAYRQVINPTKGEMTRVEVRNNKDINSGFRTMAENNVKVNKDPSGRLDTSEAIAQMKEGVDKPTRALNEILKEDRSTYNIESEAQKAIESVRRSNRLSIDKDSIIRDISHIIGSEKLSRNGSNLNAVEANNLKSQLWKISKFDSLSQQRPFMADAGRELGSVLKESIEKNNPETIVKDLNKRTGDYLTAIKLLENAHGRVIKGGGMGRLATRVIGGTVGAHFGPVGAIIGERLGAHLSDHITDPQRITSKAGKKYSKYNTDSEKSLLQRALAAKQKTQEKNSSVKLLEAPKTVFLPEYKGKKFTPLQQSEAEKLASKKINSVNFLRSSVDKKLIDMVKKSQVKS